MTPLNVWAESVHNQNTAAANYETVSDDTDDTTSNVDLNVSSSKAKTYSIIFKSNGTASGTVKTQKCLYDQTYTLNINKYKRKGYTFEGWNTKVNGSGTPFADCAEVFNLAATKSRKITLYAQWRARPYTVNFILNGGTISSSKSVTYYVNSKTIKLKSPSRTGYKFAGWYTSSSFKKKLTKIVKGSTGDKNLYAKWTPVTYTVKFMGNKSTSGSVKSMKCTFDRQYTLKANKYKRKGYIFKGWNTRADGTGTTYGNQAVIKNLTAKNGATIKLYAIWEPEPVKYNIAFNGNGATSGSTAGLSGCLLNTDYSLTYNGFVRKGYSFVSWNTNAKGTGQSYSDGQTVRNLASKTGTTVTLYAQWSKDGGHTHIWSDWNVKVTATCTKTGTEARCCLDPGCSAEQTRIIPKRSHQAEESVRDGYDATCTTEGYTGDIYCGYWDCEYSYNTALNPDHENKLQSGSVIPALGHDYQEDTELTRPASCLYGTHRTMVCQRCFASYEEDLDDRAEHNKVTDYGESKDATCCEDGLLVEYCSLCDTELTREVLPATGHNLTISSECISCDKCGMNISPYIFWDKEGCADGNNLGMIPSNNATFCIGENYAWSNEFTEVYECPYIRVESSNPDVVEVGTNVRASDDLLTYTGISAKEHGTAQVSIYFDDNLFKTYNITVGYGLTDAVKQYRSGNTEDALVGCDSDDRLIIQRIAEALDNNITDSMTDWEKAEAMYSWVKDNMTYGGSSSIDPMADYFINKVGVCRDYAAAYSMFMKVLDIECYYIAGTAYYWDSENESWGIYGEHAWNAIYADAGDGNGSQWYYVDATWGDFGTEFRVDTMNDAHGVGHLWQSRYIGGIFDRVAENSRKLRETEFRDLVYDDCQEFSLVHESE